MMVLPPKPPPISAGMARMSLCGIPVSSAAHGADHELALAGAPDRGLAVGDADQAGVRLDIALMHRPRSRKLAFDDHVSFLEARFDVAELVLQRARDVGGLALELDVVVKRGGASGFIASLTLIAQGSTS